MHDRFCAVTAISAVLFITTPLCAGEKVTGERPSWTASQVHGTPEPPAPFQVRPAFPNLRFERPLAIAREPASGRLFVVEQAGKIFSFEDRSDVSHADLAINLKAARPQLQAIYGLAFHPQFAQNRYVYICYVDQARERSSGTQVSRFTVSNERPPQIQAASELPIIRWRRGGHNGGCLKFGPDGMLYISTGDSEVPSPPDPLRTGQDISDLMSSILRIDVDHRDAGRNYRIPPDNPFVGTSHARAEVWAYGFRNPWKMNFDQKTGELWVGDVGWELWEMIHRVHKGGNYGWSIVEGHQSVLPQQTPGPTPVLPPAIEHPHSEAGSITGGLVYYGRQIPELHGTYVYGDYQTGIVWSARFTPDDILEVREVAQTPLKLVAFGTDGKGELLLLDHNGQVYRLIPNPEPDRSASFPKQLSQTGLFTDVVGQIPATGVLEYQINASHWADFTQSRRWMALPGTDRVTMDNKGNWIFPEGSVLVKTVSMPDVISNPDDRPTTRPLETQILHRENGTWRPYTYVWNQQQTDAVLADAGGLDIAVKVRDTTVQNGIRQQQYHVAARRECQLCHNPWVTARTTVFGVQSASPLAINAAQLGGGAAGHKESHNQTETLFRMGIVDEKVYQAAMSVKSFVDPYNENADLNDRARAWLHVNCAHCHQFNAGGAATIVLAADVPLEKTRTLLERPGQGTFGISAASIIRPGDPEGSVLYFRISKRGAGRMPRAGSVEVDVAGARMIHDWIAGLPADNLSLPAEAVVIRKTITELAAAAPSDRRPLIDLLLSSTRGALTLLSELNAGKFAADLHQQIVSVAAEHSTPEVRDLFERFVPADRRVKRLGTVFSSDDILKLPGDAQRGRDVFFQSTAAACSSCHRFNGQGRDIGPDLSNIRTKYSRRQLLTHILEPSRFIEPKYVPWLVETTRGRIYTGLLVSENADGVVLKGTDAKQRHIKRSDIEQIVRQQKSLMPELLLKDLTAQQVADLLAFLSAGPQQQSGISDDKK